MKSTTEPLALIVGGSSAIGLDTARRFVARGLDVVLVARDTARLEAASATLGDQGLSWPADLYDPAGVDALVARIDADAAERSGARLHLPAGAIAGIDGLAALRLGGLATVTYSSTKPPEAWRGTPAEEVIDLASLREPTVFFTGTAREAARRYPRNANLAATVALAGIGFDRTQIHLIADPRATGNAGRIEAEGRDGKLDVTFAGRAAAGNPKTSASTALSLARTLLNANRAIVI